MEIDQLIEELQRIRKREGNIEVTCMHSLNDEGADLIFPNHYETTVENLIVNEPDDKIKFKRVRLWL